MLEAHLAAGGRQIAPTFAIIGAQEPMVDIGKCLRCNLPLEADKLHH